MVLRAKEGVLITCILVLEICVNTMTTSKVKTVMSRVTVKSQNFAVAV